MPLPPVQPVSSLFPLAPVQVTATMGPGLELAPVPRWTVTGKLVNRLVAVTGRFTVPPRASAEVVLAGAK